MGSDVLFDLRHKAKLLRLACLSITRLSDPVDRQLNRLVAVEVSLRATLGWISAGLSPASPPTTPTVSRCDQRQ